MSRRVIENTKGTTDDLDTVSESRGGWRKPITGEMGIYARGICGVNRKAFVKFYTISRFFFLSKNSKRSLLLNLQLL